MLFQEKIQGHEAQTIRKTNQESEKKKLDLESLRRVLELNYKK